MVIYVSESGSDRTELIETLVAEGVTFQECKAVTEREAGVSSIGMVEVQANVPEVFPVPKEFIQSEGDVRAWRLPSERTAAWGQPLWRGPGGGENRPDADPGAHWPNIGPAAIRTLGARARGQIFPE